MLSRRWARAIEVAADRVAAGRLPDVAVLDSLHAGAGTPMHMNVNEVIANVANERLGSRRGRYALGRLLDPRAITSPRRVDVALRRRLQAAPAYRRLREAM